MEMIYFLKGKAHINVGDSSVNTSIYDVIVYLPEQRHQEEVDLTNNQEVICIGIDIQLNEPIDQSNFKLCDRAGILRWLFEQIHREYHSKNRTSSYLTKIYAQAVILQFIKHLDRRTLDSEEEVLERIQNYIQQNLSTTITPPQLAAMGHISKSYLHRLFKKHLQTTPVHYINQIRIVAAQSLLLDTTYSIRDIAQSVGFEDVNYFSRVFKRLTGTTPSKFTDSHKISNFK
jgi:YesN/AraC family two-component response regulator